MRNLGSRQKINDSIEVVYLVAVDGSCQGQGLELEVIQSISQLQVGCRQKRVVKFHKQSYPKKDGL